MQYLFLGDGEKLKVFRADAGIGPYAVFYLQIIHLFDRILLQSVAFDGRMMLSAEDAF